MPWLGTFATSFVIWVILVVVRIIIIGTLRWGGGLVVGKGFLDVLSRYVSSETRQEVAQSMRV